MSRFPHSHAGKNSRSWSVEIDTHNVVGGMEAGDEGKVRVKVLTGLTRSRDELQSPAQLCLVSVDFARSR